MDEITDYYENDNNYRTVIGQIVEYKDEDYTFDMFRISTGDVECFCCLPAKSADVLRINEFDFSTGGVYKFTIGDSYNAYHRDITNPIVAVRSVNDTIEYLSYVAGKANLLEIFKNSNE